MNGNENSFYQFLARTAVLAAFACAAIVFAPRPAAAAKSNAAKPGAATQTVRISADSAQYSLEQEVITIEGGVSIESGDMKVSGAKLVYDNNTHVAALTGSPVTLMRGPKTKATAGRIVVNLDERRAEAQDGVFVEHRDGAVSVTFKCEALDFNYQTGDAAARSGVEMVYRDEDREKAFREQQKSGPTDSGNLKVAVSPARITASKIQYNVDTGALKAAGTVRVALPELTLDASDVNANLKDRRIEAAGGISAQMKDMTASAGRAEIHYGKRTAVFEKGVRATRGADVMTGERVEVDYTPGKRAMRVKGPVDIRMEIPQDTGNGQSGTPR
jgi:lipopolysaccharide assembly outer membrane protein LptD (OstA)